MLIKMTLPNMLINNAGIYPMEHYLEVGKEFLEKTLNLTMTLHF